MKKPKVFILMDDPTISTGYAQTCRLTAEQFDKMGFDVYCGAFNGDNQNEKQLPYCHILPNLSYGSKDVNEHLYGNVDNVLHWNNKYNFDLFFYHNDFYRHAYYEKLPEELKEKSVWWVPYDSDKLLDDCASKTKNLIAVTKHAQKLFKTYHKSPGYIPHAVNTNNYFPVNKHGNTFVVCRVDRNIVRKKWHLTLEAFAKGVNSSTKSSIIFDKENFSSLKRRVWASMRETVNKSLINSLILLVFSCRILKYSTCFFSIGPSLPDFKSSIVQFKLERGVLNW